MNQLTTVPRDDQADDMPVCPRPDLTRLAGLLRERDYTPHAIDVVTRYADRIGTLEGLEELGYIDPADRADADTALEESWPAVPSTSHAWDEDRWHGRPSRWTTANGLTGGILIPPELEPDDLHADDVLSA